MHQLWYAHDAKRKTSMIERSDGPGRDSNLDSVGHFHTSARTLPTAPALLYDTYRCFRHTSTLKITWKCIAILPRIQRLTLSGERELVRALPMDLQHHAMGAYFDLWNYNLLFSSKSANHLPGFPAGCGNLIFLSELWVYKVGVCKKTA